MEIQFSWDMSGWKMCYELVLLALDQFVNRRDVTTSLPAVRSIELVIFSFSMKLLNILVFQFLLGNPWLIF